MIHIEKDFDKVPEIIKKEQKKKLERMDKPRHRIFSKLQIDELKKIYNNKCAYCESKLNSINSSIEHYRPQEKYYWLSYEWSNLILLCSECRSSKKYNFEIEGIRVEKPQNNKEEWKANSKSFLDEKPLLLHPEIDNPEKYFYFYDNGYINSDDRRGKYTIKTCNLNRESLVFKRREIIEKFQNKEIKENNKSNEFSLLYQYIQNNPNNFSKITESKDIYNNENKELSYAIKQIKIKNFHGIKETEILNIPIDTQWIFLTGENGFGKTTILQALVLGLFGKIDNNKNSILEYPRIEVEFKNKGLNQINNVGANDFFPFENFVAYGSSRLNILKDGDTTKTTQTYSIFNSDGYLLNIEDELKRYAFRGKHLNKFENIKKILCQLMPNIEKIEVKEKEEEDKDIVIYYEKDEYGKEHSPIEFNELASGYKSIIAMFGDMIVRLSKGKNINSPSDLEGIVIIDELDLHFHPNWQKKLPKLLSDTFPKIQFIVSTHSVIPFLGALENSVFLKVTRDEKSGVKLHKLDIDIKNLLPNTILTSPIFDFEGLIPSSNQKIEDIRTEDNYKKLLESDEIKKRLEEFENGDDDFPDELFK